MHLHYARDSKNNLFLLNAQTSIKTLELFASLYTNLTNLQNIQVLVENISSHDSYQTTEIFASFLITLY